LTPDDAADALVDAVEALAQARTELELVERTIATERFKVMSVALYDPDTSVAAAERSADLAAHDHLILASQKLRDVRIAEDKVAMLHTLAARSV
jgi:hypothetical protein